jgi:hypothetical protein
MPGLSVPKRRASLSRVKGYSHLWLRFGACVIAVALFVGSRPLSVMHCAVQPGWGEPWIPGEMPGYYVLTVGWLGPPFLHYGWYANPLALFVMALLFQQARPRVWQVVLGALTFGLALSSLISLPLRHVPDGNTPDGYVFQGFGPGIALWLASVAVPVLALSALRWAKPNAQAMNRSEAMSPSPS